MKSLAAIFGTGLLLVAQSTQAICGDCNLDGSVTINELITAVRNALEPQGVPTGTRPTGTSRPANTPTPLPNRCSSAAPGTRISIEGTDFIVVEVPVYLEGTTRVFNLRYPATTDAEGDLANLTAAHTLSRQKCDQELGFCPLQQASLCGFPAALGVTVYPGTQYSLNRDGTADIIFTGGAFAQLFVRISSDHAPLQLTLFFQLTERVEDLPPISDFGYRFTDTATNYPESPFVTSELRDAAAELLDYVSIRPAN